MIISIIIGVLSFMIGLYGFIQIIGSIACFGLRSKGASVFTILLWCVILTGCSVLIYCFLREHQIAFWIGYGISFLLSIGRGMEARHEYIDKNLIHTVVNACHNCLGDFENRIRGFLKSNGKIDEELYMKIRNSYLDDVTNCIAKSLNTTSREYCLFMSILVNPSAAGYDEIDTNQSIMAGSAYALAYYAVFRKKAKPQICIQLNHMQNQIMESVLQKLDQEFIFTGIKRNKDNSGIIPPDQAVTCPSCGYDTYKDKLTCEWCGSLIEK